MGRSEAPKLDSLAPNADSPLRQPRQFFLKLLLGGFTLGVLLLPLVAALLGELWGMLVVLSLAVGIVSLKWARPSALDAVLRTSWHFVIVPQWREGREHLSSLEDVQKVAARCIQVLVLLGLGAMSAHYGFRYYQGEQLLLGAPSSVRALVEWLVEEPASHLGVLFQLFGLLPKVAFALGVAVASLAAVPIAVVGTMAGLIQTALGVGEGLLLVLSWLRTPKSRVIPRDESSEARLILCQLSDVHLSVNAKPPVELAMGEASWPEATLPDGKAMMQRLSSLLRAADAVRPELIAITGDLTDTGASEEWDNAESALRDAALQSPVLLIPGNHDLCFNPIESPDLDRSRSAARRAQFLTRAARIERGPWAIQPGRAWRQVFPRMHTTRSGVHLFAFDTNGYGSRQTLSNAVGIFGNHALTQLERELARLTGPVVVMAHHHVARPLEPSFGKDPFLIALDARALLDILCRYNARDPEHNGALVVHGHRHLDALTRYENHRGRVDIYSHPSSTLGHENKGHLDGVGRFASVWLDPRGQWLIKSHAVELCAATAQARVA